MRLNPKLNKITIVGNIATGKTTLARRISYELNIPVTHVDAIQFSPELEINSLDDTRKTLFSIESQNQWIIDGHGPLDMLENRFALADQIIFIDRSVWLSYMLLTIRQIKNIFKPRTEFEGKKSEINWQHTVKIYKTVWRIHTKMRPELRRMLNRDEFKEKVLVIKNLECFRFKS